MRALFNNIPLTIPKYNQYDYKKKAHLLLMDIGWQWYINNLIDKTSPIKKLRLSKEA